MANILPSKTKEKLCYYYARRFLPVASGLAEVRSASFSSSLLWCYCFAASRRRTAEEDKLKIRNEYNNGDCGYAGRSRRPGARLLEHLLHDSGTTCELPWNTLADHRNALYHASRRSARARRWDRVAGYESEAGHMSALHAGAGWVVFREQPHFLISSAKGRSA
jgi:hypothetical protein